MDAQEIMKVLGKTGELWLDGLDVEVTILNVKHAYGNTRYEVTPVSGGGIATVNANRVKIKAEA